MLSKLGVFTSLLNGGRTHKKERFQTERKKTLQEQEGKTGKKEFFSRGVSSFRKKAAKSARTGGKNGDEKFFNL
jgi:hypothetical protein